MVGVRVAPDNNDIVVWKLDDAGTPFVNSSTSSNAISHAVSDLTTLSGTVLLQQPSLFAASGTNSCIVLTGNQATSPRNYVGGANGVQPQPPVTFSCWIYLRTYNSSNLTQHFAQKQKTTNVWSGSSFATINTIQNRQYTSLPNQFDMGFSNNSAGNGGNTVLPGDFNIPLNMWCHVGWSYDGTTQLCYVNGNYAGTSTASPTGNFDYTSGGNPGPWFFGAIPGGSGSPEEFSGAICDYRIANVIRPLSYFQNIYQTATQNSGSTILTTKYYKLRAYDLGCRTPTPVYWTDISVNYNNAPSPPCGGPLGPIEIVEIYIVPNG